MRRQHPNNVFYENDRNTIVNKKGEKISLVEDAIYGALDNKCAPILDNLRTKPNNNALLNDENLGGIRFFIINLYCRIPKFDLVFNDFFNRTTVRLVDKHGNEVVDEALIREYSSNESMRKVQRSGMFQEVWKRINEVNRSGLTSQRFIDYEKDMFLCGDYPILYMPEPTALEEIANNEMFLPVSAQRMYYTAAKCSLDWDLDKAVAYNAIIIDQSHRYVCGPDKDFLLKCIEYHRMLTNGKQVDGNIMMLHLRFRLFYGDDYRYGAVADS